MSSLEDTSNNEDIQYLLGTNNSTNGEGNERVCVSLDERIRIQFESLSERNNLKSLINEFLIAQTTEMGTSFIKLDDLTSILSKVVIEALSNQEKYNNQLNQRLEEFEKLLWQLNRRVDFLTDLRVIQIGKTIIRLEGSKDYGADLEEDQRKLTDTLDNSHLEEDVEEMPSVGKGQQVFLGSMSDDSLQRAAAKRQYEANMLAYRKSDFSLHLNNLSQWLKDDKAEYDDDDNNDK